MINEFLEEYFDLIEKYNLAFGISEDGTLECRRINDSAITDYINRNSINFYMDVYDDEIDN